MTLVASPLRLDRWSPWLQRLNLLSVHLSRLIELKVQYDLFNVVEEERSAPNLLKRVFIKKPKVSNGRAPLQNR